LGCFVVFRAGRSDVSWAFIGFYAALLALRVAWLGQNWAILVHQIQNGSLLLFTFFMISDPMTIPNHRYGRFLHAGLVALAAFLCQYALYRPNGLLWALFFASPLVPLWDRLLPASKYVWVSSRRS